MLISEVVALAKYSELSGVSSKNDINAIVAFINLGMIELYTRFPIRTKEHLIELIDGQDIYEMPADFMYATHAYGEAEENAVVQDVLLPINDETNDYSLFFVDWNTVQIPLATTGSHISIIYIQKPDSITVAQAEDGTTNLDLPDTLVDALLSYLGYRAHLGVKSDAQSENNAHWLRFERNCEKARELGVAFPSDSMTPLNRIAMRGFV